MNAYIFCVHQVFQKIRIEPVSLSSPVRIDCWAFSDALALMRNFVDKLDNFALVSIQCSLSVLYWKVALKKSTLFEPSFVTKEIYRTGYFLSHLF